MRKFYKKAVIAQVLIDYISVLTAFVLGYLLWKLVKPEIPFQLGFYVKFALPYGLVYIFIFWLIKLYEDDLSIINVEQLRRIIEGWIIGTGVLFSLGFLSKEFRFSRLTFLFTVIILFFLMVIQRSFFFRLWQKLHRKGIGVHRAIIVGADATAIYVFNLLVNSPWLGIVPVGFVDDEIDEVVGKDNRVYSTLGKINKLDEIISFHKIEQAIITYGNLKSEELHKILEICSEFKVRARIIPHFYNASIQRVQIENLLGVPLLSVNIPKSRRLYFGMKKFLDVIISALVLICLFPLFLFFAFLIKRDSSGPVLFSQERIGQNGKLFKMYKFRSMDINADRHEECPKALDDPRITRIGRFLRKTSLDELTQFINVLKGDMSIVGPRPEMPFIVEKYDSLQKERLKARPGVTGLWQISHQRGSPIHENIDYDLYYIENQSFTMDLAIIINTIFSVVKGVGAC